jgi:lysyl-tRNA synthetase class II
MRGYFFVLIIGEYMSNSKNLNKLELNRLEKLENIISRGLDPFPAKVERTHTSAEATVAFEKV